MTDIEIQTSYLEEVEGLMRLWLPEDRAVKSRPGLWKVEIAAPRPYHPHWVFTAQFPIAGTPFRVSAKVKEKSHGIRALIEEAERVWQERTKDSLPF